MVIILPRVKSGSERMAEAFHQTGTSIAKTFQERRERKDLARKEEEAEEAFNSQFPEYKGLSKDLRGSVVTEKMREKEFNRKQTAKQEEEERKRTEQERINQEKNEQIEESRQMPKGSLKGDAALNEKLSRPIKEEGGIKAKPTPEKYADIIEDVIEKHPDMTADQLGVKLGKKGVPTVWSDPYIENRRRTEEARAKEKAQKDVALRKETLPLRQMYANKALIAQESIRNKEHAIELIQKGNIDDPTMATLAEALPFNLGKRLLSDDTVEYKAGLVDDFRDLSSIFKGATRVKEVEIYENKIADLYLTDSQKQAVLKARINSLRADLIRGEVAAQVERDGNFEGAIAFQDEVEKRSGPSLDALKKQIWDETKSIIDLADNRKNVALDWNDSDDKQIIMQIMKEAGNNKDKARQIAKQKGYKF
jgi:hypothetical protein